MLAFFLLRAFQKTEENEAGIGLLPFLPRNVDRGQEGE